MKKLSIYKVTFESNIYLGKTLLMGNMIETTEGKLFDYTIISDSKDNAIESAKKQHTLPINKTIVIEINAEFFIKTTHYKYSESRGTTLETFDTKKEMDKKYKEYLNWIKMSRRADDKWLLEVVCSDGRSRAGKIDC